MKEVIFGCSNSMLKQNCSGPKLTVDLEMIVGILWFKQRMVDTCCWDTVKVQTESEVITKGNTIIGLFELMNKELLCGNGALVIRDTIMLTT